MSEGSQLKIEPRVLYSGSPYFTWTKDNGPLPNNVQTTGYVLYVPSVTKDNQGVYTLTLQDQTGTAKIQVTVIVNETPGRQQDTTVRPGAPRKIQITDNADVELEEGESANLLCNLRPVTNNRNVSE
jgi:hypothetical protein